jgi:hypothetical protein
MKKLSVLILVLVLLASMMSLATADRQGNNPQGPQNQGIQGTDGNKTHPILDNETEHEIQIMNNSLGAEIRLLQLQKALITNIIKGVMAVQVLKDLHINTSKLEPILTDLQELLEEVRAVNASANDSVVVFVELKNESKNLTTQFREALQSLLDHDTIAAIKEQLRNITSPDLENCSHMLRYNIRQFNRNQLYRLYGLIGPVNMTLINEYVNGNFTVNEVRLHLHSLIGHMTHEQQDQIYTEIKGDNIKKKIHADESMGHHGNGGGL